MHDVIVTIELTPTETGGRNSPIVSIRDFNCPVFFRNIPKLSKHGYDCRLFLSEIGKDIQPGETAEDIKMGILTANEVLPYIKIGTKFDLWEGKVIGTGVITKININAGIE